SEGFGWLDVVEPRTRRERPEAVAVGRRDGDRARVRAHGLVLIEPQRDVLRAGGAAALAAAPDQLGSSGVAGERGGSERVGDGGEHALVSTREVVAALAR